MGGTPEVIPSDELLLGRRAIEGLPGVELLSDFVWDASTERWALPFRIRLDGNVAGSIAPLTDWYALIDPVYPFGDISVLPAKVGGIAETYPHQLLNTASGDSHWRNGKICVQTPMARFGRVEIDVEPFKAELRLRWTLARARQWTLDAASGNLVRPGDPFELPTVPGNGKTRVFFSEDAESLAVWQLQADQLGLVEYTVLSEVPEQLVVTEFQTANGNTVFRPIWGKLISRLSRRLLGVWLRLSDVPVIPPWAPPLTWADFAAALSGVGIDPQKVLRGLARLVRDGKPHMTLIGFPISASIGGPAKRMHWLALKSPIVSFGVPPGFRPTDEGHWQRDRLAAFRPDKTIDWVVSESWHPDELGTRGRLTEGLRTQRVLLIGAGALGSAVAELLVRGGNTDLVVFDAETLEAGNLVRHALTLADVGRSKASMLAAYLNTLSPHAQVDGFPASFPKLADEAMQRALRCQLVIECTGGDTLLHHLAMFRWGGQRTFVSASVGIDARRLFLYATSGTAFPADAFRQALQPWLRKEIDEHTGEVLPREGIGCWHPVFPAGCHDIWLLASAVVKELESIVGGTPRPPLVVYEQLKDQDAFKGLQRLPADA